jgi:hypothetical protein
LTGLGDILTVRYMEQKGYVFNCLKTVSPIRVLSVNNPLNNLFSAVVDSSPEGVDLFKSDTDLDGHFCSLVFRKGGS